MSKARTPDCANASSWSSGSIRTIKSSLLTPTAMLPESMKAIPPNIFRSVISGFSPKVSRTRDASASS